MKCIMRVYTLTNGVLTLLKTLTGDLDDLTEEIETEYLHSDKFFYQIGVL